MRGVTANSLFGSMIMIPKELVSQQERHLKWRTLDNLECIVLWIVGILLATFVVTTFLDVVTRTVGRPWLWLQEVTRIAFIWGVFLGASVAVRRNQHFCLANLAVGMSGWTRMLLESLNHGIMIMISVCFVYFGYELYLGGFGNVLPITEVPLATLTIAMPVFGLLSGLFTLERWVNGWQRGFEGGAPSAEFQR